MESSEDDAGTATNTSRRPLAREKDVGQAEDVCATGSFQQESSEVRASCETPAMSEENFDGDSVPSPSTQDVNTSTEAILDMIDEIVDGPGAPKRLPLTVENVENVVHCVATDRIDDQIQTSMRELEVQQASISEPDVTVKRNEENSEGIQAVPESTSKHNRSIKTINLLEANCHLYANKFIESTSSQQPSGLSSEVPHGSPQSNIPSSSVVQTDQSVSHRNEVQSCERTVKCVTSSDTQDNVVIGRGECTSSDNSLSEDRVPVPENVTRSPLRRRLIRPAPSDRRPDSTVSSTVDMQSIKVLVHEQSSSECVVKDVSSSSDAVAPVHGNIKPHEIRNISEVSICKAETSLSPVKKIKLIRQKLNPQGSHREDILNQKSAFEKDQCQSTSENLPIESISGSTNLISTSKLELDSEVAGISNNISLDGMPSSPHVSTLSKINECSVVTEKNKTEQLNQCSSDINSSEISSKDNDLKKIPPIKLSISATNETESVTEPCPKHSEPKSDHSCSNITHEELDSTKQVPKLTIKLGNKQFEENRSPVPKVTIKPIKTPAEELKDNKMDNQEQIPNVTKLHIKPIPKRPEKITDIHRKSSSSEISESECSENDESTSTSDQASTSDQGPTDVVPKVTIKLGKVGTDSEGQFYTEKNIPKLTIKGIQPNENEEQDCSSNIKLVINQPEDKQTDKVPKLTIKTVTKCDSQPVSPKLSIKPIKPPDLTNKESASDNTDNQQIPKLKISTESFSSSAEGKDCAHIPKITIKPVLKTENLKKSVSACENYEQIPKVTKLNIKPIVKPLESNEITEILDDKVPVVSKLNIKPVIKPKDNEIDSNRDDLPKITKLNIKPLKNPEVKKSEEKDCDLKEEKNLHVITKLNIKNIVNPLDDDTSKDENSENQSSETGNSSDDNNDHIPVVTKLNIKPILRPTDKDDLKPSISHDGSIPNVTKINIKPILKPEDNVSLSPKKESLRSADHRNSITPVVTKLNIKPVLKPEEVLRNSDEVEDLTVKNPPLVMKFNMKTVDTRSNERVLINSDKYGDNGEHVNSIDDNVSLMSKVSIKPVSKNMTKDISDIEGGKEQDNVVEKIYSTVSEKDKEDTFVTSLVKSKENCIDVDHQKINDLQNVESSDVASCELTDHKEIIVQDSQRSECISNVNKLEGQKPNKLKLSKFNETENFIQKVEDDGGNSLNPSHSSSECVQSLINAKQPPSPLTQNCTLLKKLLETKNDGLSIKKDENKSVTSNCSSPILSTKTQGNEGVLLNSGAGKINFETCHKPEVVSNVPVISNDVVEASLRNHLMQGLSKEINEHLTKPLEINVPEKITNQSSGQDSPRIILKINKTDHGPSAKIITEEIKRPEQQIYETENAQDEMNDNENFKKSILNIRRKLPSNMNPTIQLGKRLRSSRVVENKDKSPTSKKVLVKRPSTTVTSPTQNKELELSILETKRLKLGQLLSNKSLSITPVITKTELSPTKKSLENKQEGKLVNHTVLNSENCSKNGNSKLHNILSNLQANQIQVKPFKSVCHSDKNPSITPELESSTSTGSCEQAEITAVGNKHPEMIFQDNSESHEFNVAPEEISQDPLEVGSLKTNPVVQIENFNIPPKPTPTLMVTTPQPKKRGRPRKIPLSEGAKVILPTPALEERPQRSLRLSR